ncbi:NIPSNAP family protein [Pelomonas cellulosilytica]|uniref:NIPSNAP family protein n=1 Tax=Pelomonas cellulosilytica TaxID=2906762 RepID=A0ABS8XUM8_9BURK|nr:NIPSNAP family protein [Pelomonas sp. P8]MCE4554995.1 NIPSNAP family protein [Pelomonas sp. P8]
MFVEQRIYSLVPGGTAEYIQVYEACGRAVQERILGPMLGYYTRDIGELNQLVYFWQFTSMDERTRRRNALMADAEFKVFRSKIRHLVVRQENTLLVPASAPQKETP